MNADTEKNDTISQDTPQVASNDNNDDCVDGDVEMTDVVPTLPGSSNAKDGGDPTLLTTINGTTTAAAGGPTPTDMQLTASSLSEIWSYFLNQLDRIDDLERRVTEHTRRARRRIANGLDQRQLQPSHRRSHARLFVTHQFDKLSGIWTLVIDGKLLIGNLDHANAALVDTQGVLSQRLRHRTATSDGSAGDADTAAASKNDDEKVESTTLTPAAAAAKAAAIRHQQSIEQEPTTVEPLLFTHLFEKLEVTFRTIYQPKTTTVTAPPPPKKSRSNKRKFTGGPHDPLDDVNPKDLRASEPVKLEWYRDDPESPGNKTTTDAHAFFVKYNNHFSERPPPPNMKFYSIVADIKLYPSCPPADDDTEALFQVSKTLAGQFFPYHSTEGGTQRGVDDAEGELPGEAMSIDPHQQGTQPGLGSGATAKPIPLENSIHVPALLTYSEIALALFQYIQDHKLHDPSDKSYIQCDKVLQDIFEVESMSFSQLKQLLLQKSLITRVQKGEEPVILTYIMTEQSTSKQMPADFEEMTPSIEPKTSTPTDPGAAGGGSGATAGSLRSKRSAETSNQEPEGTPTVISFDMDVAIPSLYNVRGRDFLRRAKCRELDYTTSRAKARHLLVSGKANDEAVKIKMEQCVSGKGYTDSDNVPVFLALAKVAPPNSEARAAAQIDARACDLVARIEESGRLASTAWQAVDAAKAALTMKTKKYEGTQDKKGDEKGEHKEPEKKGEEGPVKQEGDGQGDEMMDESK